MTGSCYTALAQGLPVTVPFVGPETQERARGATFAARLGANEQVFAPSPRAVAAMQGAADDAGVTSDGAYPALNFHVAGFGGVLHKVPYREDREDQQALIAKAVETGAKLISFANPDNPMGR